MNSRIKDIVKELQIETPNFECPIVGQTAPEIVCTLDKVKKLKPKIVLEIGSASGGFIYLLSATLGNLGTTFITIDPYTKGTKYEKQYDIYKETTRKLKEFYSKNNYICIRELSSSLKAQEELSKHLDGKKIDFFFIDGSHEYEDVINDWNNYRKFWDEEGLAAFHDIVEYPEVYKAWKEIYSRERGFKHEECRKEGIPLLSFSNDRDREKFGKPMILGVGYLYK
jgi:predicted O-methyltransferase YrrM